MRLAVRHRTTYRYRSPVALQPHRLLLFPRPRHDLVIVDRSLELVPAATLEWGEDVFGNTIATAGFAEPAEMLRIESRATVEQGAAAFPVFAIAPRAHRYPFAYDDDERTDLGALLGGVGPDDSGAVSEWARGFVAGPTTDTLSLLKDLNTGILPRVAYRTRDEAGTQPPAETLRLGSGSCRDIAALFIAAARQLGFGARAVSGYLFDPDQASDDAGSTHAWAEVYLPGAGWVAFDPTHRRVGAANLIPVAVGRYNQQIMPVSGGYAGAAADFVSLEVEVEVRRI